MKNLVDFRLAIMVPPLPRILKTGRESIWCANILSLKKFEVMKFEIRPAS